jgi:hypothetical protein
MWRIVNIWTENVIEVPNGFLTRVLPIKQMKTRVLNFKKLKTQVPLEYLTLIFFLGKFRTIPVLDPDPLQFIRTGKEPVDGLDLGDPRRKISHRV